jgi:class 3 adenylate cyclase
VVNQGDSSGSGDLPEAVRRRLRATGASEGDIRQVSNEDDLFALIGDLVRRKDIEWMSIEEVANVASVSVEEIERYRLLVGLPSGESPVPAWTATGVDSFRVAASLAGEDGARDFMRVLAGSAARVAATATAWFLNEVGPRLRQSDLPTMEALDLIEAMTTEMIARTPIGFEILFREHLLIAARRGRAEHEANLSRVAVAFVDLAGSTSWAEQVPHIEQAAALSRFEDAAWSVASNRGARLVKMIGDEAMLVGTDPPPVVQAAADICAVAEDDPSLPPARGAVGYGPVYARSGDYYGPLVNLVARSVKVASPGHLMVTRAVAATLSRSNFEIGEPESHSLRGIDGAVDLLPVGPHHETHR